MGKKKITRKSKIKSPKKVYNSSHLKHTTHSLGILLHKTVFNKDTFKSPAQKWKVKLATNTEFKGRQNVQDQDGIPDAWGLVVFLFPSLKIRGGGSIVQ